MKTILAAVAILTVEEGYRESPYRDTEGYPTVGIGQRIGPKSHPLENYGFTCPLPVAKVWLRETVHDLHQRLADYSFYHSCSPERQAVLISMAYQLGLSGLLKFQKMIAAIESEDWGEAKREGLDSLWAQQTPERANRHMSVIFSGSVHEEYEFELNQ